jgi:hypothetical protein
VNVAALVTLGFLDLIFAQCQKTGLIGRDWEQFKNFMFSKILIFKKCLHRVVFPTSPNQYWAFIFYNHGHKQFF